MRAGCNRESDHSSLPGKCQPRRENGRTNAVLSLNPLAAFKKAQHNFEILQADAASPELNETVTARFV